jgi:hypothetical protein
MFFDKRLALTLLAIAALAAPGCSGGAEPGADDGERVERSVSSLETTSSEYRATEGIDPDVPGNAIEIWARVYRPKSLAANTRYPLLVFMHGNHAPCGTGSNPRVDDAAYGTRQGVQVNVCPPGYAPAPSHEGYGYIAEDLAASGYIVVSINTNFGINALGGPRDDRALILARGRLLLKHLALLSHWDKGDQTQQMQVGSALAAVLQGHLDFSNVGLLGHSRGGEGCRAAYNLYKESGSPWPTAIRWPVTFTGIFEIGPTDGLTLPKYDDTVDTRSAVLLPMCDGDIVDLEGVKPFDRMQASTAESVPGFKSTLTVWGTNHNYYNTEWQTGDSLGCEGHPALFVPGKKPNSGITGSEDQRKVGKALATTFFLANVGAARTPSLNALFDPKNLLSTVRPDIAPITPIDRGFLLTPASSTTPALSMTLPLEDFSGANGVSTFGKANGLSNVTVVHEHVQEHDFQVHGGHVTWSASAAAPKYFQINFAAPGSGISLMGYETLDLRVERSFSDLNPSDSPTDFSITLVTVNGVAPTSRSIKDFVTLTGPFGSKQRTVHMMLQTARIPLASFGAPLGNIRGIRVTFDATPSGEIYLANIRATKAGAGASFMPQAGNDAPVNPAVIRATPEAPADAEPFRSTAATTRARPTPTTFADGRVVSFGKAAARRLAMPTEPDEIEIEVTSSTPFPVMDDELVLHLGAVDAYFSHYPDPVDSRRVVFTMSTAERRLLRGGEEMTVTCGGTQWNVGRLSRAHLAR